MINPELLKKIIDFDDKQEKLNYDELIDSIDLLEKANFKLHNIMITARMKKLMKDFGERETDIYVVSYPKSGTTLMQMILYQLTTDGNMDFNHLYDVSPWCRFSAFFKRTMPSVGARRIIKTHDDYEMLENIKKGKFIFLIRDYLDAITSLHQHVKDYNDPAVNLTELSNRKMKEWFTYNTTWIQNKNQLDVLYIHYEDIVADKMQVVFKIAEFLDIAVNDKLMQRVLHQTSLEFMKKHEHKFGEQPEQWKVYNNFIRKGKVGEGKINFTADQLKAYRDFAKEHPVESYLQRYFRE
jgi:hypothetical protein